MLNTIEHAPENKWGKTYDWPNLVMMEGSTPQASPVKTEMVQMGNEGGGEFTGPQPKVSVNQPTSGLNKYLLCS